MLDPEAGRVAELLAAHAVLLLGLGLAAAIVALIAVVAAVRTAARFRHHLLRGFAMLIGRARRIDLLNRLLARTTPLIPAPYLALHLTLGLLLVMAVTVFAALSEDIVTGGEMAAFDAAFAQALRNGRTPVWEQLFSAVSWFGSREVLVLATVAVAIPLLLARRMLLAAGWIAAQAGGGLLNLTLKETFERTRPEFADPILAASSWSFPSGHVMGTFILCGLGCYLAIRERDSWTASAVAVTLALSWSMVMAFSRLYLGVHFLSDVVAGLLAGVAWVAVCVSALEVTRGRITVGRFDSPSA